MASLPILSLFLMGIFSKHLDAFSAKIGFVVSLATYVPVSFVKTYYWMHWYALCMFATIASSVCCYYIRKRFFSLSNVSTPREVDYVRSDSNDSKPVISDFDIQPFSGRKLAVLIVLVNVIVLTVVLNLAVSSVFLAVFFGVWTASMVWLLATSTTGKGSRRFGIRMGCSKQEVGSPYREIGKVAI